MRMCARVRMCSEMRSEKGGKKEYQTHFLCVHTDSSEYDEDAIHMF